MFSLISKLRAPQKITTVNNPAERTSSRYFSSTNRMSIDNTVKTESYQYKFHNFNNELLNLFQTRESNFSGLKKLPT